MSHKHAFMHKVKKIVAHVFQGLSLRRDPTFIPNLVMCVGVVLVWRGVWSLVDMYFYPDFPLVSNILSILLGVFIIYLPDNSFTQLWWIKKIDSTSKEMTKKMNRLAHDFDGE